MSHVPGVRIDGRLTRARAGTDAGRRRGWKPLAQLSGVVPGGLTDAVCEGLDEGTRVSPAARERDDGDVLALGEKLEAAMDAQLRAPSMEAHAQLGLKKAAERPFACTDASADRCESAPAAGIAPENVRGCLEAVVARLGEVQRKFWSAIQLIMRDVFEAPPLSLGELVLCAEGEDDLA
jgi:hypothetical protein